MPSFVVRAALYLQHLRPLKLRVHREHKEDSCLVTAHCLHRFSVLLITDVY